ncbi:hypothetical protein VTN77DRAFT_1459 [Rasamsonia byssochlamydoides]|uniref:uncharacterized protein n=1 Tax=Rasamsonia byssochlamydoides TaxID=89139 RepID=UPI0037434C20
MDAIKMQSDSLEYALFLCRGHSSGSTCVVSHASGDEEGQIIVLDEAVTPNFEDRVRSTSRRPGKADANVRVVLLSSQAGVFIGDLRQTQALFEEYWAINMRDVAMLSSHLVSSYHSRAVTIDGEMCLEICYNISESLSYVANEMDPLGSSFSVNSHRAPDMVLQHKYEPLYFRYNVVTGQTTYILLDAKRERRELLHALGEELSSCYANLHPLALQTVILFHALSTRTAEIDNLFRRLLWIETQLQQGSIFEITDSEKFAKYIQLLHRMSRTLITLEHSNQRDQSNVDRLLRDHARLWKMTRIYPGALRHRIDSRSHERVRDNLLCLRDFCLDRERQILNLRRRTQDFITLLYNLITGHDSATNLRIAAQSAHIAHESKKDSTSMKIIAAVTLFYCPATFVCSLFGTNLVALNTNDEEPTFVVSKMWWLYIVCAVPLTVVTMLGFVVWRRWREGRREQIPEKFDV